MNSERKSCFPLRRTLVDVALIAFILACVVATRTMIVITEEARLTRTGISTEIAETRVALLMQVRDLTSDVNRLSVNSSVLTDRLDSQLTRTRSQIHDAAKTTQAADAEQTRQIRESLTQTVAPAAAAIATVASEVSSEASKEPKAPVVVAAPPPQVITVKPEPPAPVVPLASPVSVKRKSVWKRVLQVIAHPKSRN